MLASPLGGDLGPRQRSSDARGESSCRTASFKDKGTETCVFSTGFPFAF